eukprot:140147-Amphidinium_carterae.1
MHKARRHSACTVKDSRESAVSMACNATHAVDSCKIFQGVTLNPFFLYVWYMHSNTAPLLCPALRAGAAPLLHVHA